ncbi:MAG: hypothetical protein B7Y36_18635 [Novosphingobium sp. 28-62-57]|uniref:hypothetical protein n=1 Tax=unclassified Novosphingobium TaxID=2644732 RepID=UPI000BCE4383|nr:MULTISPECIES: hypothetical protein [unclassified Novosphingobium]OYW50757.1 MAG: hypothetical protein B7Z34_02735 [Novosphingobium sp. 12-62-10]OYZ07886.1 MAG: hypothetical protein B7Y36_18635 [Novosphingobium sp. 28-62-57]
MTSLAQFAAEMDEPTRRVVMEMSTFNDFPVPYLRDFARDIDLPVAECRRIVLSLKEKGITGYGPLYSPDGLCVGSSYWLTELGIELRELVRAQTGAKADKVASA